jgi:hypothetical protein
MHMMHMSRDLNEDHPAHNVYGMSDAPDEKRDVRIPLLLTKSEAAELDRWRRARGIDERNVALREMMRRVMGIPADADNEHAA